MAPDPAEPRSPPTPAEPPRGLERRVAFEAVRQRLFARRAAPVTIGRFVVTQRVGEGGMGVVYAAYDPQLERKVALKVVRPLAASPRAHAQLEREARAAAGLGHPNVVTVYECGTHEDGAFFIAMEFVEGQTLRQWLQAAPRRWPEIVELLVGAGRGLAAAHEAGIVHRDFKPDNVLVGRDGRARVADFGLARSVEAMTTDGGLTPSSTSPGREHQPATPSLRGGTPGYMAPEQRDGEAVGPAADQFALCATLHEALLGTLPAIARGAEAPMPASSPPRAVPRAIPRALHRALRIGLDPDPQRRHPSLSVLVDRLEAVLRARRRRRWLAAGVAAAVLAGAAGRGLASPEPVDPCADADARMEQLWSPERREAVAARLAELPAPTPGRALTELDAYAQAWSSMRLESCEATRVRGEQSDALLDLRVACLDRRAYALEGLLARLEGRDDEAAGAERQASLERAAALVHELVPVGVCEAEIVREQSAGANMTRSRTDRTRSPEAEQAWQQVVHEIEDAQLQARLGEVEPAIERLRRAEPLARAHALTQLEAEVAVLRAHLQLDLDPKAEVRADVERALERAQAAADGETAVECVAVLLRLEREQPREAADPSMVPAVLLAVGRGLAARTHDPARARARLAQQEAALLSSRGERQQATEVYRQALAQLHEAGVPDHDSLVMGLRNNLGAALIGAGHHDEAEPVLTALWQTQRQVLPPDAAALAPTALALGNVARHAGRLDEAVEHYRTARAIFAAHRGPDHDDTLKAVLGLAKVEHQRGNLAEAARQYEQVLAARERSHGRESTTLLSPLLDLVALERERARQPEAVAHGARAAAIAEARLGAAHPVTAATRLAWGQALLEAGRLEAATARLTAAHEALQGEDANPEWRGEASLYLARALHASAAPRARVRALIDEAEAALSSVADSDVMAAAELEKLRQFAAELEEGARAEGNAPDEPGLARP